MRRLAPGKSVLDLGGMWGIHGDVAFWSEEAGASRVVLCDGMDPTEEFHAKHRARNSRVAYVQYDLHDTPGAERLGCFDVVWCAGVLYHSPNPFLLLENLRLLTRDRLLLGMQVIPEIPGFEQACLWYPGLGTGARKAFAAAHGTDDICGVSAPFDYTPMMGYANCFWGITLSALRAMLEVANFSVLEEHRYNALLADVLAEPIDRPSVIPPARFARDRDEARRSAAVENCPAWLR